MKTKYPLLFIILRMVSCSCMRAQKRSQEYVSYFVNDTVEIDGNQKKSIWKNKEPIWFIPNEQEPSKAKSWFKSAWNEGYLFFYFWMEDKNIKAQMTKRDVSSLE